MDWFVFALLSTTMFAVCNVTDKFILTKKIKDPYSYNILSAMFNIFPILLLVFFINLNFNASTLLAILYGFVFTFLFVLYNKAMMKEDASRLVSIIRISPIFVLTLSFIFLHEILSTQKYFGIIFLIASALLVSYKRSKKKFHLSTGIILILFYSLGIASMSIIAKYTLGNIDYWEFYFWNLMGNILGCLPLILIPTIRKNLIKDSLKIDKRGWLAVIWADIFAWMGYIFYFIAISINYVSLISAVVSVQPLIVFIFTLILTIHRPKILKEEISRSSLLFKALAVILIIIGSYLIVVR